MSSPFAPPWLSVPSFFSRNEFPESRLQSSYVPYVLGEDINHSKTTFCDHTQPKQCSPPHPCQAQTPKKLIWHRTMAGTPDQNPGSVSLTPAEVKWVQNIHLDKIITDQNFPICSKDWNNYIVHTESLFIFLSSSCRQTLRTLNYVSGLSHPDLINCVFILGMLTLLGCTKEQNLLHWANPLTTTLKILTSCFFSWNLCLPICSFSSGLLRSVSLQQLPSIL